jgi:hypothetical protein
MGPARVGSSTSIESVMVIVQALDDVFDALFAACVARAPQHSDSVRSIRDEEADVARRECWIYLPTKDPLDQLGGPNDTPNRE